MPVRTRVSTALAAAALILFPLLPMEAQKAAALSVAEAQQRLLHLTAPDDLTYTVSAPVQRGITTLKDSLVAQTDATVTHLPANADSALAGQRLRRVMPPPGVGTTPDTTRQQRAERNGATPVAGLYGGNLTLSIQQPTPSLLLVQESFDIACGNDTVLLAYGHATGSWQRTLLWQSKPYQEVSGAFGDTFKTLLLRPRLHDHPLLLVLHGTPWCTSTMSGFAMDAFELGAASTSTPAWHGEHGYRRLDLDPPLTLKSTPDGFEIRTSVETRDDRIGRKGILRYAVGPDGIHRVEPLGLDARDTVDEWMGMPRKEAEAFADAVPGSLTWQMFQTFTYRGKAATESSPSPTPGPVRACSDDPSHFQAEITSETFQPAPKQSLPGPTYFVHLREVPNGYRIHAVTSAPDASCSGPDLMGGK
ncbi:MAG: hypothetical protein INR62_04835 [Rhodospirillales bacterium]|nr:hypothetical protein [Acetobacter sp.]